MEDNMKKLIEFEAIDIDDFSSAGKLKTIKDGKKYLLDATGGVMFHEDLELVDAIEPDSMGVPCHEHPDSELSVFYVAGEYRLYNLNMELIDTAPSAEWLVTEYIDESDSTLYFDPYDDFGEDFDKYDYEYDQYLAKQGFAQQSKYGNY